MSVCSPFIVYFLLERLEAFWEELNEQVTLKRNGNQEQAQKIAQQIQIQAAQQAMPATESMPYTNQHVNQHFPSARFVAASFLCVGVHLF